MYYKEIMEEAEKLAPSAAMKLCGNGLCIAPYPCGRVKNETIVPPVSVNTITVCPLEKYNIIPVKIKNRSFMDTFSDHITVDELNALCLCCDYSELIREQGQWVMEKRNFVTICLDCPVQMEWDRISEASAEASCS